MRPIETELALLHVPQLAASATSAKPAWLWNSDGSRLIWANAIGAAIFGAANVAAAARLEFRTDSAAATQVARLATSLRPVGQERLERLRGFGARFGALTCICSRIGLFDGSAAILIAAAEPAGPALPLAERARRLFADDAALAVFAPDGTLLHAGSGALVQLGGPASFSALGIEAVADAALAAGHARGTVYLRQRSAEATVFRLGEGESRVLVLTLPAAEPGGEATPAAPNVAATATDTEAPAVAAEAPTTAAPSERRHPLRFVWQMDAVGRFVVGSDEFIELIGPRIIAACGRLWSEIAAELNLDPQNQVARAMATHETWSGIEVSWPIDNSSERVTVELSGLPVFDRSRQFGGYRGFGVCRDVARINQLLRVRHARPIGFTPPQTAVADEAAAANAISPPAEATEPTQQAKPNAPPKPAAPLAAAANVVPFRTAASTEPKVPTLSPGERNAFRELAQELTARLSGQVEQPVEQPADALTAHAMPGAGPASMAALVWEDAVAAASTESAHAPTEIAPAAVSTAAATDTQQDPAHLLLDRVPAGILVHREDALLYANHAFLDRSGYDSLDALAAAGGLASLFAEPGAATLSESDGAQKLCIATRHGERLAVEGRLFAVPWYGGSARALIVTGGQAEERHRMLQTALETAQEEIRELKAGLGHAARHQAQQAAAAKADFIAKVSHEIRTPLNSMIGFAEVIMAERFGAIGNERYREYLKDIHTAGTQLVSLLNDLVDLSKVESGQLDLNFASLDLNDLTRQCVAVMQPQANRARIIIRSALASGLSQIIADPRSVRQIVINLLSHAIKLTGPGGQVIISTAAADGGEAVLRVRDTGVGMHETAIDAALDPFRDNDTSANWSAGGSGLGLPLTKALAEANHAAFRIKSAPNAGTLVEIAFPVTPLAAQ
jgi:signal transduction histidine kinase